MTRPREVWVVERAGGEPYVIAVSRVDAERIVANWADPGRRDRMELRVRRYVPEAPDEEPSNGGPCE